MTNIDQFESVFKAADKPQFQLEPIQIKRALLVTDLDREPSNAFLQQLWGFLGVLKNQDPGLEEISLLCAEDYQGVADLLEQVCGSGADLVCTYRNLHIRADKFPYSLGVYVDVLTQAAPAPVMLLPRPDTLAGDAESAVLPAGTGRVMAITDHLAGDHHLVSFAAKFTQPQGSLCLTHVEDERTFDRYVTTIGKIPTIDTDEARTEIHERLLKEPLDYVNSCRRVLREAKAPIEIVDVVTVGHQMRDYRRLVEEHQVDLLVMNTKDDDQLAMHGVAYPLTVELRRTPMLLL